MPFYTNKYLSISITFYDEKKFFFKFTTSLVFLIIGNFAWGQKVIQLEKEGGVYIIPNVKVNGVPLRMIYDTGASDVSLSLTEAKQILKHGQLDANDFIGVEHYRIANGDITEGFKVLIKEIEIDGIKLKNIEASIVINDAPVLLGQSVLEKLGITQFDPKNHTLTILNANNQPKYNDPNPKRTENFVANNYPIDYKGSELFTIKAKSYVWEMREMKDGNLLVEVPYDKKIKLLRRHFDWWEIEYDNLKGWVHERNILLPPSMLWLNTLK